MENSSTYADLSIDESRRYSDHYNKIDFLQERYQYAMQQYNSLCLEYWKTCAYTIQMYINDLDFQYSAKLATEAAKEEMFCDDYDFGQGDWDDTDMTDMNSLY